MSAIPVLQSQAPQYSLPVTQLAYASPNWWQPFSQLLWLECVDFVKVVVQLLGQVEDEDAVGNLMQDDQQDSAAAHIAGKQGPHT